MSHLLKGKLKMSILHSFADFKREMRFWKLREGYIERGSRLCAAKMAALHAARPEAALPPFVVGSVRDTSLIAIGDVAMPHITPRRAGGETCDR